MTSNIVVKNFRFRIFPSKAQTTKLVNTLDLCRDLFNASLQERRDAYRLNRISLNYYDQANQLKEIKETNPEYKDVHSQISQDVLKRVDKAFQNFFRRVKQKSGKAGFPRFQNKQRYNSFTFAQSGFSLTDSRLTLSKIGKVKIKLHRAIVGKIKTLTVSRDSCGKWFACFSVETAKEILEPTNKSIGIDAGITTFLTLRIISRAFECKTANPKEVQACPRLDQAPSYISNTTSREIRLFCGRGQDVIYDLSCFQQKSIEGFDIFRQRSFQFLFRWRYNANIQTSFLVQYNPTEQPEICDCLYSFFCIDGFYLCFLFPIFSDTLDLRQHYFPDTFSQFRQTSLCLLGSILLCSEIEFLYFSQNTLLRVRDVFPGLYKAYEYYLKLGINCQTQVEIDNPRFLKTDEKILTTAQRRLSKQPKGSKERYAKRKIVAKIHNRIKNRRSNFAHQVSRFLVNSYDVIVFEDLNVKGMMKNHCLARSIADVSWNQLISFTKYKAENADRKMIQIRPNFTSQDCSNCGNRQKMPLDVRLYECSNCHISIGRDLNASLNILSVGLNTLRNQSVEATSKPCLVVE